MPIRRKLRFVRACSYAQKGVSMRVPEASALVEAIMDGRVHRDYVTVGGQQCVQLHLLLESNPSESSRVECFSS